MLCTFKTILFSISFVAISNLLLAQEKLDIPRYSADSLYRIHYQTYLYNLSKTDLSGATRQDIISLLADSTVSPFDKLPVICRTGELQIVEATPILLELLLLPIAFSDMNPRMCSADMPLTKFGEEAHVFLMQYLIIGEEKGIKRTIASVMYNYRGNKAKVLHDLRSALTAKQSEKAKDSLKNAIDFADNWQGLD
jgi:hypothetical protein